MFRLSAVIGLLALVCGARFLTSTFGADPIAGTAESAQRAQRIAERDRLDGQVRANLASGQLPAAIQAANDMLAVEIEVLGADHDDADGSRRWLAEMHALSGDSEAAKRFAEQTIETQSRLHGADHWQTRAAQQVLKYVEQIGKLSAADRTALVEATRQYQQGSALATQGQVAKGIPLLQQAADAWRKSIGESLHATAERLTNLARWQHTAGDFAKAASNAELAATIDRKALGEHPDTALALEWLGIARRDLAQYDKAAAALSDCWAMRKNVFAAEEPITRMTGSALGNVYVRWADELEDKDDVEGAKNGRAQWLSIYKQIYPADGWQVQDAASALARTERLAKLTPEERKRLIAARAAHRQGNQLYRQDKSEEGRVQVQQAYDTRRELLGAEDEMVANSLNLLGLIDTDLAKYAPAETEFQQAIAIWGKNKTDKHPDVALGYVNLATNYDRAKDLEKATAAWRKGYEGYTAAYGKQDSDTKNALTKLVMALKRQAAASEAKSDWAAADKHWTEAVVLANELYGADDWHVVDNRLGQANARALARLTPEDRKRLAEVDAQFAQAQQIARSEKAAEALPPIKTCLQIRTELLGPDHPSTNLARTWLAIALRWNNKLDDAAIELRKVIETSGKTLGTNHPGYAQDLQNLGHIYLAQNRPKPAAELFREAYLLRKRTQGATHADANSAGDELITALDRQATGLEGAGDFANARPLREEALVVNTAVRGPDNWVTINARYVLDSNERLGKLDDDQRASLKTAFEKLAEASQLSNDKKPVAALSAAEQSLRIRQELLGEKDRLTAVSRYWVGLYTCFRGDVKAGLQILLPNMENFKQTLGTDHPEYAHALLGVADIYRATGDHARANAMVREALAVRTRGFGAQHQDTQALQKVVLASLEQQVGELDKQRDLTAAKNAWTEILAIRKQLFGDKSWQASDAQWALYRTQLFPTLKQNQRQELQQADQWMARANHFLKPKGEDVKVAVQMTDADWRKEERNNQTALEAANSAVILRTRVLGENNPLTADALEALAGAQVLVHDPVGAKASLDRALAIRKQTQGATHPAYLRLLKSRASELARAAAIPYDPYAELNAAQRKRVVERDRMYDRIEKAQRDGDTSEEARQLQAMLALEREVFGEAHSEVAATYRLLAEFYSRANVRDYRGAGRYYAAAEKVNASLYGADSWQATECRYRVAEMERFAKTTDEQWRKLGNALNFIADQKKKGVIVEYGDQNSSNLKVSLQTSEALRRLLMEIMGQDNLEYANCLEGQATIYRCMQNTEEWLALLQQSAELTARLLSPHHPISRARLDGLADEYHRTAEWAEASGDYEKAQKNWKQYVEIEALHYGLKHWKVATARLRLATSQRMAQLSPADQKRVQTAVTDSGHTQVESAPRMVGGPQRLTRAQQLAVFAELLGEDDPLTIEAMTDCIDELPGKSQHAAAVSLLLRQLAASRRTYGDQHPLTGSTANELGLLYYAQGNYALAEPLFQEARTVYENLKWNQDPAYVDVLNNLAVLYEALGDMDRAEPILRRLVKINAPQGNEIESRDGEAGYDIRDYRPLMAGFNVAEVLKKDTVEGAQMGFSRDFTKLARYTNNLALVCQSRRELDQAEKLLRQAVWMVSVHNSIDSLEYADAIANLALLYKERGNLDQAEDLLARVVEIRQSDKYPTPKYAQALGNLGSVQFQRGNLEGAASNWQAALRLRKRLQGEQHPSVVLTMAHLAMLADSQGKPADAAKQLDTVIHMATANLQLASAIQSERQQLLTNNMLRGYLDEYLSVSARAKLPPAQVYQHVLSWKGQVAVRQRKMRQLRSLSSAQQDSAAAKIYAELDKVNQELGRLTFAPSTDQSRDETKEVVELSVKKDEFERSLARQSGAFEKLLRKQSHTPEQLKSMLPADTALVDIVEYSHVSPASEPGKERTRENRLAAFVLRGDREIVQVDLGPAAPLEKLVEQGRQMWSTDLPATEGDPPAELREKIWVPLVPHLEGVKTVLVSPDGAVSRVPLAALPGKQPGTYLLEEVALAVVPVPQLLAESLESKSAADSGAGGLLLVGDVDFDSAPGVAKVDQEAAPREGKLAKFGALPGTLAEVKALEKVYAGKFKQSPPTVLSRAEATESAFRQQAVGARYLHLATHGFFAPAECKSADREQSLADSEESQSVEGWNPGLLSGIVLAGVNQPVSTNQDDGILTAAEVANLDLSAARLVVLSACESGLGQSAGGEGTLGLQRAFQTAGAGSVVSSLWKVDDAATQLLMTLFYENLWTKKMSPLAAFREAQLSLLNGKVDTSKLRGLVVAKAQTPQASAADGRLSPRLWAAFVVSGSPQ